jgi:hypothetical protein
VKRRAFFRLGLMHLRSARLPGILLLLPGFSIADRETFTIAAN